MKLRYLIIGLVLLLTLVTIGTVGFKLYKNKAHADSYTKAIELYNAGKLDEASELLTEFTLRDATREEVFVLLAEIAEKRGDYAAAVGYWERAAGLNPLDSKSSLRQAKAAMAGQLEPYAVQIFEPLFASKKLNTEELFLYGNAVSRLNPPQLDLLASITDALAEQAPDSDEVRLLRALHLMLSEKPNEAKQLLDSLITSQKKDVKITALRARVALAEFDKDYELTEKLFQEALALDLRQMAGLYAAFCKRQGRIDDAIVYLKKAVKEFNMRADIVLMLAAELTKAARVDDLKELRAEFPVRDRATAELSHYLEALEAFAQGNRDEVVRLLEMSTRFQNLELYRLMELSLLVTEEKPDIQQMVKSGQEMIQMFPGAEIRYRVLALISPWLPRLLQENRVEEAGQVAELLLNTEVLEPQQKLAASRAVLAGYMKTQNIPSAITAARGVLQQDPNDQQAISALVDILPMVGRTEEALGMLQRLPDSPARRINEARLYERQGKIKEAHAVWRTIPLEAPAYRLRYATFLAERGFPEELQGVLEELKGPEYAYDVAKLRLISAQRSNQTDAIGAAREALMAALDAEASVQPVDTVKMADRYGESGLLLAGGGLLDDAETLWRKALVLVPLHRLSLVNLSNVLAIKKQYKEAEELAEKAYQAYPDWGPARDCREKRQEEAAVREAEERARLAAEAAEKAGAAQ